MRASGYRLTTRRRVVGQARPEFANPSVEIGVTALPNARLPGPCDWRSACIPCGSMSALLSDVRHAARSLARTPWFAASAVCSAASGTAKLAAAGRAVVVPEAELTADRLSQAIEMAAEQEGPAIDMAVDGAAETVRILERDLTRVRPGQSA